MGRPPLHIGDLTIVVRLSPPLLNLLDQQAKKEGIPRNTLITRELANYCKGLVV